MEHGDDETARVTILVVDYGMGNLRSIVNMFSRAGLESRLSSDPDEVARAERLVLPGVGAFDAAMTQLDSTGLRSALETAVRDRGRPVLGICLGMQLLADSSEEGGETTGLGWIPGRNVRFRPDDPAVKVPHMGWSEVTPAREHPLLPAADGPFRYYFVHSYHLECDNPSHIVGRVRHGSDVAAAVAHEHVWGVQFHPEKSHRYGMRLLARFAGAD